MSNKKYNFFHLSISCVCSPIIYAKYTLKTAAFELILVVTFNFYIFSCKINLQHVKSGSYFKSRFHKKLFIFLFLSFSAVYLQEDHSEKTNERHAAEYHPYEFELVFYL